MKMLCLFATSLILAAGLRLSAVEHTHFHFKTFQVADGLSENTIYSILQDSKGYLWFGTKDGLNRFDGTRFRVFRQDATNPYSIGENFVRCIAEGENGVFFIGTDAGLYRMNAFEETFTRISRPTTDGISLTSAVNSLYRDTSGIVWIGTIGQGIFTYDPTNDELKHMLLAGCELGSNAVWQIYGDRSGIIWVATRLGLLRYNKFIDRFEAVDGLFGENGSTEHEILSILEDTKGNLWLGTWADGLRYYNKQSFEGVTYLGPKSRPSYVSHIRAIFQYDSQRLLVGSDDGLYMFNTETMDAYRIDIPQSHYSLSDQNIYSIARDREGGIWIGTYFGGINYLNASLLPVELFYPDIHHGMLSGMAVSQFCEDHHGNFWIATEDGGVNYLEVKTRRITQPIQTSYHNTHALLLDGHNLWIGTFSRGIDVYDTRTGKMLNYRMDPADQQTLNDDCIFSLYRTKNGDIYAGTPVGLNRYDRNTNRFERIHEASGFIYDIKEDEAGNLWIAGSGVIRFDPLKKSWIHYDAVKEKTDPITGSKLTSVYIDNQKRLFFTSDGRGLFVYDYPTDSFRNISEKDGLPNNVTYGVLDDAFGNLWISCNKGIVCIDINHPADYKLYDQEDGMQSNQFNYKSSHKARDGKFYFGGINGFNSFYPQDLASLKNDHIPPVEITGIQLEDVDHRVEKEIQTLVNRKQRIVLSHDMSSFSISYISLSFRSQNKNQYAYRLEGMDNDWTMAGNNKRVTYLNLPPGKYVFHVKASNNNEVWNETGDSIEIEILPPYWRSLPAQLIYILLIVSSCYLLFTYYIRKNRKKQAWQLETFKFEQEKLAVRSKIDFFTNIAHEVRTPVSLIKAPLEEVLLSGDGTTETRQNLSIIDKNCNRLSILINQLLDFRKMDTMNYTLTPESINLNIYISELYERFRKTALSKKIEFSLQMPGETDMFLFSDPDALTKVVGNLLTNAIKFTTNRIAMTLERIDPQTYAITIEDNGKGIPDEQKKLIFDPFYQVGGSQGGTVGTGIGLSLVKSLALLLKGRIEVSDGRMGGAVFRFTFSNLPAEAAGKNETTAIGQPRTTDDEQTGNKQYAVLMVDDNPEITSFIHSCLHHTYQVETASNASEAWEKLEETSFDLIISDIMMPDTDGISFTKRIKADINYSHIPVILLSAKTENAIKVEGLRSGAEVFMEKPFSTSFLKAQIRSLLTNRRALLDTFNRSPLASYTSLTTNKSDEAFLSRLNEEIEKHLSDQSFSVESLTDVLNISRSNLQRKLKGICGVTPGDYLRNYRLKKASKLLLETDMRISEVAYCVGFTSASYFTKAFIRCYNMTPKEFLSGKSNPHNFKPSI